MRILNLIESKINKHRKGIKVYWWRPNNRKIRNFGDEITPIIIEKIWGMRCRWTRLADSDMIGAGSIIDIANTYNPKGHNLFVWGSGFIEDGPNLRNQDIVFGLVRGPLSAARITQEARPPCGDPGLLASRVFPSSTNVVPGRIGILPHMKDLHSEEIRKLGDTCYIISPYQKPEEVAKNITSCEMVFSSSLHGLIFADSFGVPNFRVKHNILEGGDYKFMDYYQSTNRDPTTFSLNEVSNIIISTSRLNQIRDSYKPIQSLRQIQDIIITAFPLKGETVTIK